MDTHESSRHLTLATREAWRAWLEEHHATAGEASVAIRKKNAAHPGVSYEEAVEEALCFGWIDGQASSIDEERFAVRFTPRRPRSVWSESNKRRVEKLIAEGRMTPAGLAKVAEAKANGEWEAAAAREDVDSMPSDLEQALKEGLPDGRAWDLFQRWSASRKKQYLYWLTSAKRSDTRQRRIQAIVQMAMQTDARPLRGGPERRGGAS